jgi:glycosyltransferase involved in cell wall biosynthesis
VRRVKYPQFSFNPFNEIGFALYLYSLKADLVHFTMTQFPILYFGNIVCTTHDTTMLDSTRNKDGSEFVHRLKEWGYRFLMWWGHRKAKHIIVPTYSVKKDLVRHHGFTLPKIEVTYEASGVPLDTAAIKPDQIDSSPYIFYVGTAFPHKNLQTTVLAYEKLLKNHPDLKLYFAGKKEFFYEELDAFIARRPNARETVKTLGFVSNEELKWLMNNTACYVFASKAEGFGLPGLEAMANGAPVAASNIPVLKEVLGDAAGYFDPDKPESIARVVNEIISKPQLRKEMVSAGKKQVQKYSWEKMAQETKKVYEASLAK